MPTDFQLATSAIRGDLKAFDVLIGRYQGMVQGLAFYYTRNFADAEDIAQEVLIQAFKRLEHMIRVSR